MDGRPILGDVVGYNEDVVGKLSCSSSGEYQLELTVLNLNVGYKDVMVKKIDNKRGNEVCKALGRKDPDIEVYSSTYINGAKYYIDSDGYNNSEAKNKYGLPGCKLLHSAAIDVNGGKHDFIWRNCYTMDIANASIAPVAVDYDSKESVYTYARKLMDSAKTWNDKHLNKYSGLWVDMKEQRDRYAGDKILEIAADADYLGDYVDGKGNYLFSIKPSQSDEPFIALAGKEYAIDFKLKNKDTLVSAIKAYYIANNKPGNTRYVYECHPSTKVDGVQSTSLGFIVEKFYDIETYRYIALNPYDKDNKYSCQKDKDGIIMDPIAAAGILLFTNATLVPPIITQK